MLEDEDQILVWAFRGGGSAVGRGAAFTARRLKKNVHELELSLSMPVDQAVEHVRLTLTKVGRVIEENRGEDGHGIRAIVPGGSGGMNPVVVTINVTDEGLGRARLKLRGAAKEGLIKQRAGEKAVTHIAQLLAD